MYGSQHIKITHVHTRMLFLVKTMGRTGRGFHVSERTSILGTRGIPQHVKLTTATKNTPSATSTSGNVANGM